MGKGSSRVEEHGGWSHVALKENGRMTRGSVRDPSAPTPFVKACKISRVFAFTPFETWEYFLNVNVHEMTG